MLFPDKPTLPQHDDNQSDREEALNEFLDKFQYDYSVIDGVPISAQVPDEAKAGNGWSLKIVSTAYYQRRNWEEIFANNDYVFEEVLPEKGLFELGNMLINSDLVGILNYTNPDLGVSLNHKRPESFYEYLNLFYKFSIPEMTKDLDDNGAFADYFIAGLNPVMIEKMNSLKSNYSLSDKHVQNLPSFSDDSLDSMIEEERIFVVDYEALTNLEAGEHPDQPKFVYSPIIYLAIPKDGDDLQVLGVQLGQEPDFPLVTSQDGRWDWMVAKMIARCADINFHEGISHLGLTHLLIDPIVIATFRNLPPQHPLNSLLVPHFEGTIPINALAVRILLATGGKVEQLLAGKKDSAFEIIKKARLEYGFRDNFLPKTFSKRGVQQGGSIKSYPYRDDALLVWDAIQEWIKDYVDIYYESDEDVQQDYELANWVTEIVSEGRVKNFAPNDEITSKEVLVETLTMILFTCSAQHAAVNFPQNDASNPCYQPLAGYAPVPTQLGLSEQDAMNFLPPLDRAINQIHTTKVLGETYYTQLGEYGLSAFRDPRVAHPLWHFQCKLKEVEDTIEERNESRRNAYIHLIPSNIPQSINI